MARIENPVAIFNTLSRVESSTPQPGHLSRLGITDRRLVTDLSLWSDLYHTLQPILIRYYNAVNTGDYKTSSEAAGYLKWANERNVARSVQLSAELFAVENSPSGQVLVLGTGSGFDTIIPAKNYPQRQFIATEISPVACDNAKNLVQVSGLENTTIVNADYQSYLEEVPDSSLAVVVSNWTMSGSLNPIDTLSQIYKKLKPGGMLTITESPSNRLPENIYDKQGVARLLESRGDGITPKVYFRNLSETLQSLGFEILASSKDMPDTSDTVIALKTSIVSEVPVEKVLTQTQAVLEQSRQMVLGIFE